MSDIQPARDVLKKWRSNAEPLDIRMFGPLDEPLIVGTAGNPELWDSIDGLLRHHAEDGMTVSAVASWVRNIATAIVRADERMSA